MPDADKPNEAPTLAPPPVGSSVRRVAYDRQSIDLIAEVLEAEAREAPFRLPNAAVYQMMVPGSGGRPSALLTLWPSLKRVDAIGGSATVVFTNIVAVDLVPDVEVTFLRANREYLIVARGGKIIVRA